MIKTTDTEFAPGLYMKVPKGTQLISRWSHHYYGQQSPEITKRDVVVEIVEVFLPETWTKLTEAERAARDAALQKNAEESQAFYKSLPTHMVPYESPWSNETEREEITPESNIRWREFRHALDDADAKLRDEYENLAKSRFTLDDLRVSWAKGEKIALVKDVTLVEKPESRKKEPKVNKRQQMVKKSRWKFTADHDITFQIFNRKVESGMAAWNQTNPRPSTFHGSSAQAKQSRDEYDKWHDAHSAVYKHLCDTLGMYETIVSRKTKSGEVFTIMDKFQTYNPYGYTGNDSGQFVRVQFDGDSAETWIPYKQVSDIVEAESIPTVDIWVLRNKTSGLFYKGSEYNSEATEISRKSAIEERARNPEAKVDLYPRVFEDSFTDKFMRAKHFDNFGRMKTQLLMMTGYYDGLPGAEDSLPDWAGGASSFEFSDEWEVVKFDKLARKEVGIEPGMHEWFTHSWELRALTVKYGSSVRTLYKALEKAKLLDSQKGVAVFTVTDEDKLDQVSYWGDRTALSDQDKVEIEEAIASIGAKKNTFKKAIDTKSYAVSFANKSAALMFKLAYQGNLQISIIDLEDMKEAVDA